MKKLFLISAIAISGLMYQSANAQIRIGVHFNLGGPVYTEPVAPPAPVYDDADYYYLPDVDAYYSVNRQCYFYNDGSDWVSAAYLPGTYRDFDLEHARRFEVHEARPYMHNNVYMQRYGGQEHHDWNRNNDNHNYTNRGHDRADQYRGNEQRSYQPQQNYGRGDYGRQQQAQPQQNYGRGNYGRQQQAQPQQAQPQQNYGRGGYGRQQQAQPQQAQPQQNYGQGNRGSQQQAQPQQAQPQRQNYGGGNWQQHQQGASQHENNDRNGQNTGRHWHGI